MLELLAILIVWFFENLLAIALIAGAIVAAIIVGVLVILVSKLVLRSPLTVGVIILLLILIYQV